MKTTYEQSREFLESIKPADKVAVLTHDDLDGFCSGMLLFDAAEKKAKSVDIFFYSYNRGKQDFDLSGFDVILISDLAPSLLKDVFEKIKDKRIFYTDHHPSDGFVPENALEVRTEVGKCCSRTVYEIFGGKEWISVTGILGDAGELYPVNKELLEKFYKENAISFDDFRFKYAYRINSLMIYFEKDLHKAFKLIRGLENYSDIKKLEKYILPVEKEFDETLESYNKNSENLGKINFFIFDPKFQIKSSVITKLSKDYKEKFLIFLVPFENTYRISFRGGKNNNYNGVKLLQDCGAEKAGGHPVACGGFIKKEFLETFKGNLKNYDVEKARI